MGLITGTLDERRYGRFLAKALPMVIETEAENERMLAKVEALMDKGEKRTPEENRLLQLMARLVEDFEESNYAIPQSEPHRVLAFLLEQRGLRQADLLPVLGCSKSLMSEMVSGRREISKVNAKKLAGFFGVSVELFI